MVNCTCSVGAWSVRPMSGSDGRYMSIDSGPSAVRNDSNKVSANVPGVSIQWCSASLDRCRLPLLAQNRRRVSAENCVAIGGGKLERADVPHAIQHAHVVGIIAAEKDAVGADGSDQELQRGLGMQDGVV